jgi:Tol biopolymer transport system component
MRRLATACAAAAAAALLLTAAPGEGAFPGANGKLVFTSGRDGHTQLYSINPDGTGETRLTNGAEADREAAWSPDGTKIAFVRQPTGSGPSNIWVMNADGSGQAQVTTSPTRDSEPAWSPDGTKLAFLRGFETEEAIFVVNADGSGETRLTTGEINEGPAWSPDGTRIAYSSYRRDVASEDIFLISADGATETRLTNDAAADFYPNWSPDGTKIVWGSSRDDSSNFDVYVMSADGSGVTRLTAESGEDDKPAWSPDGTKIAFYTGRSGSSQIWVMNADGSGQTQITGAAGNNFDPDWQRVAPIVPPPVLGQSVNVSVVSGTVLVKTGATFEVLSQTRQIKVGSQLDTKKGVVRLVSAANKSGRTQSGDFGRGVFQVAQSRSAKAKGLTDLTLKGGNFNQCKSSGKKALAAKKTKTIRSLFSKAKGKFRTKGRYSAASVRGTVWTMTDRCDGTLTSVKSGVVSVFDFKRHKTVKVKPGKSYLARASR